MFKGAWASLSPAARAFGPTAATETMVTDRYVSMETINVAMMALGIVLLGSEASSPKVAIRPYPV